MELKTGQRYVTRDGDITSPLRIVPKADRIAGQCWTATVRGFPRDWSPDGSWGPSNMELGLDLVKPYEK